MTTSYLRLPPRVAGWRHRQRRRAAGAFTPSRRADPAQRTFRQFQYLMPPSGSYASGFPDELAYEEWLYRLEQLVAQKHTDLRRHFQKLVAETQEKTNTGNDTHDRTDTLAEKYDDPQQHCTKLEKLLGLYATAVNELTLENEKLREQASGHRATITPLPNHSRRPPQHHC